MKIMFGTSTSTPSSHLYAVRLLFHFVPSGLNSLLGPLSIGVGASVLDIYMCVLYICIFTSRDREDQESLERRETPPSDAKDSRTRMSQTYEVLHNECQKLVTLAKWHRSGPAEHPHRESAHRNTFS